MFYDSFNKRKRNKLGRRLVERLFEKMAGMLAQSSPVKILEIGFGSGMFHDVLKKTIPNMEYTVIEPSDALFADAQKRGINVIKCFVPPFPQELYGGGNFDAVVMTCVLEHFKDYREAFDVCVGVNGLLKTGGKFMLLYPCVRDWGFDFFEVDYSHNYITSAYRTRQMLEDTGYRVVKEESYRACFKNFDISLYLISRILSRLTFLRPNTRSTFHKNILTIAEKV